MKFTANEINKTPAWSPPSRGAWIEILFPPAGRCVRQSPPSRGAWIEMLKVLPCVPALGSPPSRGAWIEIPLDTEDEYRPSVAPLAGGVD